LLLRPVDLWTGREKWKGCVGGGFGVALAQASFEGGGAEAAMAVPGLRARFGGVPKGVLPGRAGALGRLWRHPDRSPLSGLRRGATRVRGPALCSDAVGAGCPFRKGGFFCGTGAEAESLILAQNERWRRA
jgi:hypothetical protein